jgi:hypothetical protein
LDHDLTRKLSGVPGASSHASQIIAGIKSGNPNQVIKSVPANLQHAIGLALRQSFASMLNDLFYISGSLAIVGAICSMALIRQKDFVVSQSSDVPQPVH